MAMTVGGADNRKHKPNDTMEFNKAFAVAVAALGVAVGIGLLGFKAAEATGRNPGVSREYRPHQR